jgi:NACHT domain
MPDAQSTSAKGNAFRDSVRRLLELTPACTNVQTEVQIGTQPVDIYYEEKTSFRTLRVACECKDYGKPLTKDLIARNIYPRYSPLLNDKQVDAVRIIALLELGHIASAYVTECGFTFQTIDQLEYEIIDFRNYMQSLVVGFRDDGLDRYYINPKLEGGGDLEQAIDNWISGESSQPRAILAGYGMGKTSFARRLAYKLGTQALKTYQSRIPVLIPLSEISSEQTLEGLLGKLLAAQHQIPGYHFALFQELNRRGRFVILLDGFDEMKHTISWAEFTHNFEQLNRLNGHNSRVLLLGRPSALLSEDEELWVLRGKRRAGEKVYSIPDAPEYVSIDMASFSDDVALEFIQRYASYRLERDLALRGPSSGPLDLQERIESIRHDAEMMALVLRPVQAKMLADLAIDPEVQWRSFSRYDLYREFIQRMTEREARKPTRKAFPAERRLSFLRQVAWWMWRRSSSPGLRATELPTAVSRVQFDDSAEAQRDLLAGSILERKAGDTYYFPHRSFLEFLVAEYMCSEHELDEYSDALTPEVIDFIKESDHAAQVARWEAEIFDVHAPVSWALLGLIAWAQARDSGPPIDRTDPQMPPRAAIIEYLRLLESKAPTNEAANFLSRVFALNAHVETKIAALLGLAHVQSVTNEDLKLGIRKQVVGLVVSQCLDELQRLVQQSPRGAVAVEQRNPFMRMLLVAIRANDDRGFALTVDFAALVDQLLLCLSLENSLASFPEMSLPTGFSVPLLDLAHYDRRLALSEKGAVLTSFFRKFPDPAKLIPVTNKARGRGARVSSGPPTST